MRRERMKTTCWFCGRPVLKGDQAHRSLDGGLAVHADCLRDDARHESDRGDHRHGGLRAPPMPPVGGSGHRGKAAAPLGIAGTHS
jgi:hypothetical protein